MVTQIAIMIGTPDGAHLLTFSCERAAADAADAILRQMPRDTLPAPVWISCRDPSVVQRLAVYLEEVQDEMITIEFDA